MEIKTGHAYMDESRQGEALVMDAPINKEAGARKVFIETYGCQMNFSDSEIVASILGGEGFATTADPAQADLVFINTCSIRDNAEQRARARLKEFQAIKRQRPGMMIGVLGCMAERLKAKFLEEEKLVDLVVGPDAYRDLPRLIQEVDGGTRSVNVLLSREETYADISPVRLTGNGVSAFISIMRGCDNMCSFCVVPYTRGRERSRDPESILREARELAAQGYKEITLLGQNVDSYKWMGHEDYRQGSEVLVNFAGLLQMVAREVPQLRVRFSTSHPKDITNEVLHTMAAHANICNYIHLPVQSGNSAVLHRMNRTYDRPWYLERIQAIRRIIPDCGLSTDVITGFCGETHEEHADTLSIMQEVRFHFAYMFAYSERPGTPAAKTMEDDVPEAVKKERLSQVIRLQQQHAYERLQEFVGQEHIVLIEGNSKKSAEEFSGRNDQNTVVVFPKVPGLQPGDYVRVRALSCTPATLRGEFLEQVTGPAGEPIGHVQKPA